MDILFQLEKLFHKTLYCFLGTLLNMKKFNCLFNKPRAAYHFILLFFFTYLSAFSQSNENYFSSSGESEYFNKIESIFKVSAEKKRAKEFLDHFEEFWNSPSTSDDIKTTIIEISDKLYLKQARAFPDYYLFLETIQSFVNNGAPNPNFYTWKEAALNFLNQRRYYVRHFVELLNITKGIVEEQKIYSTSSVKWYSRNPDYTFKFENDSLFLVLNNTTLVCHSKNDSIQVFNTSGRLNVVTGIWDGTSGKITWERSGFPEDKVYATFKQYTINMNRPDFEVQDVTFYNKYYFNQSLIGRVKHKVMFIREPSASTYPQFTSHKQMFQIENIHPNINYKGGFSQHGAKFLGSGTNSHPATITIFRNDQAFITAKSLIFSLRDDEILSRKTQITIHLDTGEIRHPGLEFKFMVPSRELYMIRNGEGISQSPFFDTYHNVTIDSEVIYWQLDTDYMELRMLPGSAKNYSFFESMDYYREAFFTKLQGMDAIHPLFGLRKCYLQNNKQPFSAEHYARYLNKPVSQVRQQLLQLSFYGFIDYNTNTDTIKIQKRLNDYILFRMGKKDHDVIRFNSITPKNIPNARFDLKNYDLALKGVNNISISDRQNVSFIPDNQEVTLKYNRNFSFNGKIIAGMIELFGDGFFFSYDDFRIDLTTIDSMRMNIGTDQIDQYGRPVLRPIDNTIAKLSGYLQIDTANNKSGLVHYPKFPVLVSNKKSYVYYDRPDIQNGAYTKENFHFEIQPFEIDSLNELNKRNIVFNGTLKSNIFPDIQDQLRVRKDFSLGFVKQSPPQGYPIYQNKATFTNIIDLSNQGLIGKGSLRYGNTVADSEAFTFLPDQTTGIAQSFSIEPQTTGIELPDVQGKNISIKFLPFEDQLLAKQTDKQFILFNEETALEGSLVYSPNGLEASGKILMPTANLISEKMDLTHHALMADSADFHLVGGQNVDGISFKTNDLKAHLDFEKRIGQFQSRDLANIVEFTDNKYIAYINAFTWNMDNNEIVMGASGSEGNRFVSVHRRQDSLDFIAPIAVYDVQNKTIVAKEVSHINVADADILLNDGTIRIHQNAEMEPLDSTIILINDSPHQFKNAQVSIEGKYSYKGSGEYDFVNGDNKTYTITFSNITFDDKNQTTIAQGTVPDDITFNRHFAFKGDVELNAKDPLLTFDGGTQLLHSCHQLGPQDYIRFTAKINPNDIQIPIEEKPVNTDMEKLSHHFFLQLDSTYLYSTFLEKTNGINNSTVFDSHGYLRYNENLNSFEIAEKEKLAYPDSAGNILRFDSKGCIVSGTGIINTALDLEQVTLHSSGVIRHDRNNNKVDFEALFGANFMLDPNSIQTMVDIILQSKAPDAQIDKLTLEKRLREWTNSNSAQKIVEHLKPASDLSEALSPDLQHTLCFSDIKFEWDTPARSYFTNGKATLAWIENHGIAKEVDVKALIKRSRGGNSFEIHIQADDNNWFFFSYNNEKMMVLSSSKEFNSAIQALDIEQRKMKTGLGQDNYIFQLGNNNRLKKFMDFFNQDVNNSNQEELINQDESTNDEE
ncbi:hypothetical protein SAMN05444380_1184 [Thermophagus xiamenensis]|uniref:Uncharacterized protein n=1 Tax=Thermophagus xiamenensis TaxID=385682 RepID=A0A1I2D692_9BACT|nr:hypothetical protein SAMN05444380_1184 [Thermophagus xiamenensis]